MCERRLTSTLEAGKDSASVRYTLMFTIQTTPLTLSTRALCLGASIALGACSSTPAADAGVDAGRATTADAGARDSGVVALADYSRRVSESFCGKVFECCAAAEVAQIFNGAFTDRPSCVARFVSEYDQSVQMLQDSIDVGRVRYDPAAAGACVAGFAELTCPSFNRWSGPPACAAGVFSVFLGTVADGGACSVAADCGGSHAICVPVTDGGRECLGAAGIGEPCGNPAACLPGARCIGGSGVPAPPPVCTAELPIGSACLFNAQCTSQNCALDGGVGETCQPTAPLCVGP